MTRETSRTLGVALGVCIVCSLAVSTAAVLLKDRQEAARELDRRRRILQVAGLTPNGRPSAAGAERLWTTNVKPQVVDMRSQRVDTDADPAHVEQVLATGRRSEGRSAPRNAARVRWIPDRTVVYFATGDQQPTTVILPIEGSGLWSTLRGYIAIDQDGRTIRGLVFYEHGETPGLGGEIDNPTWLKQWPGRMAYDDSGAVRIHVARGKAGPPQTDPYQVDALSGATVTSRGVTNMLEFWLGKNGFGRLLEGLGEEP